ncbi:MAG: G8 domain-containing protein [Pseudomonadota bacterium]|nr:G8 domain-containing protein [Pseudomonadota bacterium]
MLSVVQAQNAGPQASRWSDPATWPNRKVPAAGDKVTIGKDKEVILDVSPPALGGLSIDGKLTFADNADLELTTEWIMLHGELAIGTEARPHTRKATITFTDNVKGEDVMAGMGDRGIMISGGTLNLHGDRTHTWTKLAATANAGANRIQVLDASGWRVGDEIVLASTDYNPRQAERRIISAISGSNITLDRPLEYMHFGKITFDVDQRGEVGLLTRNIKIQASQDAEQSYFGGHIMAMPSSKMFIAGVELQRMGQNLTLARYPIHWHLVGDAKGQYIKNAAIHDTYNRCVTVHGTNLLRVENNVTYNTVGHCFFLEDGIEHGNEFVKNLGIQTKCHTTKPCVPTNLAAAGENRPAGNSQAAVANGVAGAEALIPSDNTVSTFWVTHPDNTYIDNVAAGSDQIGFWLAFPEHPIGQFEGTEISKNTWPRRMQIREFRGNVAHSNFDGMMFDRGPSPTGTFNAGGNPHMVYENPAEKTGPKESIIRDFTSYKNRNGGIWARGEMHTFLNYKSSDNAIGFTHAYPGIQPGGGLFTVRMANALFVGESENVGNPTTPEEKKIGRSVPKPELPDFPIRGYEYYDYLHTVEDTTFRNYQDNAVRKAGALSYLLFTSFPTSSENSIERVKFINAKPAHFPDQERKWGNDNGGSGGWRTAAFKDRDGSATGTKGAYIVNNIGLLGTFDGCQVKPTWNAAVCKGDIGRMTVGGGGGGFGGFGGGRGAGPGGPPGAPGAAPRGGAPGPGAGPGRGAPGAGAPLGAVPGPGAGGPGAGGFGGGAPGAGAPGAGGPGAGGPGAGGPGIGGPRAGGARAGGAAAAPPQPPVVLSRKGKEFTVNGETNVMANTEIKVTTERTELPLSINQLDAGSWVVFELPGFTKAASGTAVDSLDALRKATATSYYKGKDALWVKLVSNGPGNVAAIPARATGAVGGPVSVQVSR